jgi:hypothetical protein
LNADLVKRIAKIDNAPVLSSNFETSVPGLYFVGLAAANSFGPMLRFVFGAGFTSRRLSKHLVRAVSRKTLPARNIATGGDRVQQPR